MKKLSTILFILISLSGSGQISVKDINGVTQILYTKAQTDAAILAAVNAQASKQSATDAVQDTRLTAMEAGGKVDSNSFYVLKGVLYLKVKGVDSATVANIQTRLNFWNDSIPKIDTRLTKAILTYQGITSKSFTAVNARIDNLPVVTPFDPSTINATLDELAIAIHDLQTGKATQVQVDAIQASLTRLIFYLKSIPQ